MRAMVTHLLPPGASATMREMQAENHTATSSGKHRKKSCTPKPHQYGEGMEEVARERFTGRWVDGWMDGYIDRQISTFKNLILNLTEPPSAQGSCTEWEASLRNQTQVPPESLCMAVACRDKANLNRGLQKSDW